MDEENQNLNDTTERKQTSGAEKVEKAGNATAKGIKAGKNIAKIVKSLKGLGALGSIAILILIIIIVIIILIGVVGFFLEMPGMMNQKINQFAEGFAEELASWMGMGNQVRFDAEDQTELAEYLKNMGYPPYEFGFGRYFDENGNPIDTNDAKDTSLVSSKYLNAYLTADYNTYVARNKFGKTVADFASVIGKNVGYVLGMQTERWEGGSPSYGMLDFDTGFWDNTGAPQEYLMDLIHIFYNEVKTDPNAKTMTIVTFQPFPDIFTKNYFTFNMSGWTARYGKPLELSLTLHLATMAPDLVFRLDMDQQEDTQIHIGYATVTGNIKFKYRLNNGTAADVDFSSVDDSLKDIDEHIQSNGEITGEDLNTIKEASEKFKQTEEIKKLDSCYANYEMFLKATIDDEGVKDLVKDNNITIRSFITSNEWYKLKLGNWADVSLENLLKNLDTCIKKAKEYDSDAQFYTDNYFDILSTKYDGVYSPIEGSIMYEYYELRDSLESDGDLSDSDCEELLTFMQDKLGALKDVIDEDIKLIKDIAGEQDEKSQKLYEQLDKIGLTQDAIDRAIDYNNRNGEGEGADVSIPQPAIEYVKNHWYKDVIFMDKTGEYGGYNVYDNADSEIVTEAKFDPLAQSDDGVMTPNDQGAFYVTQTLPAGVGMVQVKDAIRGETNEHTKELFVGTADRPAKYFVYDGSENTAKKIDELRVIYDEAYADSWNSNRSISKDSKDVDKIARKDAEDAVEAEEEKNGTNYYKEVDVRKNALSAFSILENSKSEDAEYILRDLKALFVDLGYFTKDDFKADETHVMQWPITGYVNAYWPQRRYEKQQKDHGTLIRSKVSTDNIKEGLNADGTERSADDESVQLYSPNLDPNSTSSASSSGAPDLDDADADADADDENVSPPTDTVRDGFEADLNVVSPVTGEVLEEGTDADGLGYIKIKVLDTSSIPEYAEFYEEYRDVCTGYIMYIKGFKSEPVSSSSESQYLKVKHTGKYFIENGYADDYIDLEKNGVLEEFEEAEEKRVDAPAYLEVNGKKYIKEGTVIGTTTNADLTMYLLNRENSVVEDVETYIRLVDNSLDTDWAYFYWVPYESGGTDGPGQGPEAVGFTTGNELAVGISQWTTINKNGMYFNNISEFCQKAIELNPSLCSELQQFVNMGVDEILASHDAIEQAFTSICAKDRDGFMEVQMQVTINQYLIEPYTGTDKEWLLEKDPITQGTFMSLVNWNGDPSTWFAVFSQSDADETATKAMLTRACPIGSTAGTLESRWTSQYVLARDALTGAIDEEGIINWIKTKQPADKYGEGQNMSALP